MVVILPVFVRLSLDIKFDSVVSSCDGSKVPIFVEMDLVIFENPKSDRQKHVNIDAHCPNQQPESGSLMCSF
jgi:hypothetical protein